MMKAWGSGLITMNPTVSTTVTGALAILWDRFKPVAIVLTVMVPHHRMHTDPRPHSTRSRQFPRVLVAREGVKRILKSVLTDTLGAKLIIIHLV